ncbi:MAG: prepilin peptidase [Candidatus Sungbacteria bacterium]|nr:prepilin peptidase [Candidatus Sungbacteria bacterium]
MEPLFIGIIMLFGMAMGSFLNVVVIRGWQGESLGGRSHCRSCLTELSALELIPLVSFFVQNRRCRHCKTAISWQYPAMEAGTALVYALAVTLLVPDPFVASWNSLLTLVLIITGTAAGIVIFLADVRYRIIPDGATLTLGLVGMVAVFMRVFAASGPVSFLSTAHTIVLSPVFWYDMGAAVGCMAILGIMWLLSQGRWMGFGDVKLIFATSLLAGFPASVSAFFFSFWLGGIVSVVLLALGRKRMGSAIPFGPFILTGGVLAYFCSNAFLSATGLSHVFILL